MRIHGAFAISQAGGEKVAGKSSAKDSLIVLQATAAVLWKHMPRSVSPPCLSYRMERNLRT